MELKKYVRKGGNEKERARGGGKKEINNEKRKGERGIETE